MDRVLNGMPPRTSAADALETMRVVEAAEQSANLGKPVRIADIKGLGDFRPERNSES